MTGGHQSVLPFLFMEWRKNKNIYLSILFIFSLPLAPLVFLQLYGEQAKNKISPELTGITGWINGEPLTLADLRGKVVIVDFWTYSCINCLRTVPYLNAWYKQYGGLGLVIIGVHSPEFNFEKEYDRVEKAVKELGIKYPIAMDDNHKTWDAFANRYWPHKYFIGADGNVRFEVIGEGRYDESEEKIRELLSETDQVVSLPKVSVKGEAVQASKIGTPEIYFGTFHGGFIGNPNGILSGNEKKFQIPEKMETNLFYLQGNWEIGEQFARHTGKNRGEIKIEYQAKSVN